MERGALHVALWPSVVPKVLIQRRYTSYSTVGHYRHYRTALVVHATAKPDWESEPRPLDASKSTAPRTACSPNDPQLVPPTFFNILDPYELLDQQYPRQLDGVWSTVPAVVHTALLLLTVDALCADAAQAANIRDFYVNVVYNPVILAMVAAGTYWALEKFGGFLLRRIILPLIVFTALVLLAANYRELADLFDVLWPVVVANPITSTIVLIVALVLLTSPYALVVVVLLGLVYTSQPDAFVLTPKKTINAVESQIQRTVDKQANSLQRAVDNIDATKDALSSAAKQTGSVTVSTAKQLATNAKQVTAETKKLASDTKRSFEQTVQRVDKAVSDTQAAVSNAARQVKDGIEGSIAAGKRAGKWVQRSATRLQQAVDLEELKQALQGTSPKPAAKPAEAPKPAPKPAEAPKAEAPKPAPKPAEAPKAEAPKPAPKPAATATMDKPKEAAADATEAERAELLKKLQDAQKKLERARARLNDASGG